MTLIQLILAFNPNFATDHPRLFTFIVNHPGQQEICDGWDNDCNGLVNEDDPNVIGGYWFYLDLDGDGYGVSNEQFDVYQCSALSPAPAYVRARMEYANPYDCDDGNADAYPGAPELMDGVDNNCSGGDLCEFPVEQSDGSVEYMPNTVTLWLSNLSPSGQTQVGRQEVLRFNFSVGHPECNTAVTWDRGIIEFNWTDQAGSGWVPHDVDVYNLTDDGTSQTIWNDGQLDALGLTGIEFTDEWISTGAAKSYAIYADSSGASSVLDDTLWVYMHGADVIWCSEGYCSDASESGEINAFDDFLQF